MKKVALIGSSSLSERMIYYFESTGYGTVTGLFDDFEPVGTEKFGCPVLGKIEDIPGLYRKGAFDEMSNTVGYNNRRFRKKVHLFLQEQRVPVATFVHPSSYIERNAAIGAGSIILTNCTVDFQAAVGQNAVLCSRCFLSHDVKIGDHSYLGPEVKIAGKSVIGECCFLGIGTTIIDHLMIGENVQAGAGSVIIGDVPSHVFVAGVPAVVKTSSDRHRENQGDCA